MTIEARRAIRVPVSNEQHVTFMLNGLRQSEDGTHNVTIIYEDAAGETVANTVPITEAAEKLQTIYPGQNFETILALLRSEPRKEEPRKEAPVKRIITDIN